VVGVRLNWRFRNTAAVYKNLQSELYIRIEIVLLDPNQICSGKCGHKTLFKECSRVQSRAVPWRRRVEAGVFEQGSRLNPRVVCWIFGGQCDTETDFILST
jgi:hypothetical protein